MDLKNTLRERIRPRDIRAICALCAGNEGRATKEELFALAFDADDRTSYNALWVFTYFTGDEKKWLRHRRSELTDLLLATTHAGRKRLILTILEGMQTASEDVRTDYLDYCLSRINSGAPTAIRSLCLKQAFAQCRFHPELLDELKNEIDLMDSAPLSPGIKSARRNVLKKIAAVLAGTRR